MRWYQPSVECRQAGTADGTHTAGIKLAMRPAARYTHLYLHRLPALKITKNERIGCAASQIKLLQVRLSLS